MKKIFVTLLLSLITFISFGQKYKIDFDEIESVAKSVNYGKLLNRFIANDTTLLPHEYIAIYYGQAFRDNYKPYAKHDSAIVLFKYLNQSIYAVDFNKVISYTNMILADFPLNIEQIFMTGMAYDMLGLLDSSDIWLNKYKQLIMAIMSSGDGKEPSTAFIVTCISDEYAILNALNLKFTGQAVIVDNNKFYDLINVAENEYDIERLYFDINLFYGN